MHALPPPPPNTPPNIVQVLQEEEEEMKSRVHEVFTRKMLKEHDDVGTARDLAEGYIAAAKARGGGPGDWRGREMIGKKG